MPFTLGRADRRFIYWISLQGLGLLLLLWALVFTYARARGHVYWPWEPPHVELPPALSAYLPPDAQALVIKSLTPNRIDYYENTFTVYLLASLLTVKSWAMYRRTDEKDALTWSFILTNAMFAVLYFYVALSSLSPGLGGNIWAHRLVRWPLVAVSLITLVLISVVTDEDSDDGYDDYVRRLEERVALCEGASNGPAPAS